MNRHNIVPFGTTPAGETVHKIHLQNQDLSCDILTYGATLQSLVVPDRDGQRVDVLLGYDTLEQYLQGGCYFGATVGRVANRIAGGQFELNNVSYNLPLNDGNNHHHGGPDGFAFRVWKIAGVSDISVTLSLHSPDGDQGYPGNIDVEAEFTLQDSTLVLRHRAVSDADTLCSLTSHGYFNLAGHNSGSAMDQHILLFAHAYTPSNAEGIPLGITQSVERTPMDLRELLPIQTHIEDSFPQLVQAKGYDHNYVINGNIVELRPAAIAMSDLTGISMRVDSTMPGIHFYTANYVSVDHPGKGGCTYGPRHGFCLETQFYPDAIHHESFPSPILEAGKVYNHSTVFSFNNI